MTLPNYIHFVGPLLEYLGEQQEPVRARVAMEALADRLKLSETDRTDLLPSGVQTFLQNRVGWAHDALKRSGLSSAPARGSWLITPAGRRYLQEHGAKVTDAEMARIASLNRDVPLKTGEVLEPKGQEGPIVSTEVQDTRSPREQIEDALARIRSSVARDILENIAKQSPAEFENLVLDVLHALGYRTLCIQMAPYRREEPNGIPRETSQLLEKVFAALREDGSGKAQIAQDLLVHQEEVDGLVFGLVMTHLRGGGGGASSGGGRGVDRTRLRLV